MIKSFKHKGLEKFYNTGSKAGINADHADRLRRQLTELSLATKPGDLAVSGWDLHPLKGEFAGHWSIKVNGNWRVTFRLETTDVEVVDYQDYH